MKGWVAVFYLHQQTIIVPCFCEAAILVTGFNYHGSTTGAEDCK